MLHFTLATLRLQKGSVEISSIVFCDEWNLALTGLKVIYVGQWLTVADCLHVGSASEIIWRLCAHFLSLSLSLPLPTSPSLTHSLYVSIYIYKTNFDTKSHKPRTQFQTQYLSLSPSSTCSCCLHVSLYNHLKCAVWPSAISAEHQFPLALGAQTVTYMTAASCWSICGVFKYCVSAAEFLCYGTKQRTCKVTMGNFSLTIVAIKSKGFTFYECPSLDLVTQHAFRISSVPCHTSSCCLSGWTIILFILS